MRMTTLLVLASLMVAAGAAAQNVPRETLRAAAANGLTLLEQTSPTFVKKGGCNSCHNQILPAAAQAFARRHGVTTGVTIEQLPPEVSEATTERYVEYSVGGGGGVNQLGFDLFANALSGRPADARIDAEIYYIKGQQQPDGYWRGGADRRPPLVFDDFTVTAFMVYALDHYGPSVDAADTTARIARARSWLTRTPAERTQERAFRLLGLSWSHADRRAIDQAIRDVRAQQAANGGWSQLPTLPTDAYATGMALYALYTGGVPVTDAAYQAGLRYLLSTQAADGTWHVKTRAIPFQPYFESGYPYGEDQWISAAGAAYATLAISAAVSPEVGTSARRQ